MKKEKIALACETVKLIFENENKETHNTYYGEKWEFYRQQSKNSQALNTEKYFIVIMEFKKLKKTKNRSANCLVLKKKEIIFYFQIQNKLNKKKFIILFSGILALYGSVV